MKPVALVLGGTVPHCQLIRALKRRGYQTVLIDYLDQPPAKGIADVHVQESTLDVQKVLEVARAHNAQLVISVCVDQANRVACEVGEELGLYVPYSSEVARHVTSKIAMKQLLVDSGIPTPRFQIGSKVGDFSTTNLRLPVIVKPADSNSSKGIRRIEELKDLDFAVSGALSHSREGQVIVEEYIEGREISFDSYIQDGRATIFSTRERRKFSNLGTGEQQIYGSIWGAELADVHSSRLEKLAEQVARVFNLDNTPLLVQAIVSSDFIDVIEFAPRVGGGENWRLNREVAGVEVIDYAIQSFLGERPVLEKPAPTGELFAELYLYTEPCIFGKIRGLDELLLEQAILYGDIYKEPGAVVGPELSSDQRVGVFAVKGEDRAGVLQSLKYAFDRVDVLDIHGESVLRRSVYSDAF